MRTPFGQRMYDERERAELTQKQVCKAVGISQSTLSELERSAHGSARITAFANLYHCDPHWLATGEGDREGKTARKPTVLYGATVLELSDMDRAALEAFRAYPPSRQPKIVKKLQEESAEFREVAEETKRRLTGEAAPKPVSDTFVEAPDDPPAFGDPVKPARRASDKKDRSK